MSIKEKNELKRLKEVEINLTEKLQEQKDQIQKQTNNIETLKEACDEWRDSHTTLTDDYLEAESIGYRKGFFMGFLLAATIFIITKCLGTI